MKRRWFAGWDYYIFGPIVIAFICFSLWLAGASVYENYLLSKASDQIARAIDVARKMKISPEAASFRVTNDFFDKLAQTDPAEIVPITSQTGQGNEKGLRFPWSNAMRITFYPNARAFKLEGKMPSSACKRFLTLYMSDLDGLGIMRVDVKEGEMWRAVYLASQKESAHQIGEGIIRGGCGNSAEILLSLIFPTEK